MEDRTFWIREKNLKFFTPEKLKSVALSHVEIRCHFKNGDVITISHNFWKKYGLYHLKSIGLHRGELVDSSRYFLWDSHKWLGPEYYHISEIDDVISAFFKYANNRSEPVNPLRVSSERVRRIDDSLVTAYTTYWPDGYREVMRGVSFEDAIVRSEAAPLIDKIVMYFEGEVDNHTFDQETKTWVLKK